MSTVKDEDPRGGQPHPATRTHTLEELRRLWKKEKMQGVGSWHFTEPSA